MKGGSMKRKRAGLAILVLLAALLVALPALVGCGGGGKGEENVIVIGIMADLTGTAGTAMQPTIEACQEYLEKVVPASDNPWPEGVKVKFCIPFDTQLDYSKVPGGYEVLKGRGTDLMVIMNAQDKLLLGSTPADDGMPCIGTMGLQAMLADQWSITTWSPIQSQGEVEMLFIMDDWAVSGKSGIPKVGHLGYTLTSSEFYQEGIQKVLDANPGKFAGDKVAFERGTLGNVSWMSEVGRLMSCDYIIVSTAGAMVSSFVSQARAAGYTGKFITGMEGFPGFWNLVTDAMKGSMDKLYGCYYVAWWPWWDEDVPVIQAVKDYIAKYHKSNEEELLHSSACISGWELGMAIEMSIRNAIEAVGAENVDREALRDGLRAIDVQLPGYINQWQTTANSNALQWNQRAFEYSISEDKFVPLATVYEPVLTRPAG
jgi:hypothetical protein